jgi:hypothetical protein
MTHSHRVLVCSLPEYEELVAELYINDRFVGLVSQEGGPEHLALELPLSDSLKIELAVFERALTDARERLLRMKKRSDPRSG